MSKYTKNHIAFKLAYFGWNFYGFETPNDKGISTFGQLIALNIRSNLPKDSPLPFVISDLLDVKKLLAKLVYDIANELPLVQYNCEFDDEDVEI
ncbi:21284_t:CDS:2 [Entrophospora sp. SA101]|nr:22949_t:CDS:2 [Entrophospora sp. SA101]CAJ0751091.1 21284_t:CDS:2 [Entrophospora sp. SA101]CAJ0863705.1 2032_t:CDS:2 [Entrophospora sp. SA101]